MNKTTKCLSVTAVLLSGIFLSATSAYADIVSPPEIIPGTSFEGSIALIGGGVIVGVMALVSWLVIRPMRKKKNVINK